MRTLLLVSALLLVGCNLGMTDSKNIEWAAKRAAMPCLPSETSPVGFFDDLDYKSIRQECRSGLYLNYFNDK